MNKPESNEVGLRREIGAVGIAAVTMNITMGSGLFVIPASMAVLGTWAPIAIAACALVLLAVTLCFAEASSRVPTAGGVYGFVRAALGPVAAAVVGGMLGLSGTLAAGGILAAAFDQLAPFAPWAARGFVRAALVLGICSAFGWIASRGARQGARANEVSILIKVTPLLLFLVCIALVPAAPAAPVLPITPATAAPLLILGIYLCAGMESATLLNGEVRAPHRTIPAGLFGAVLAFASIAIAIQVAASHALGANLTGSKAPVVEAAARVGPWLPPVMAAAAIASMIGCAGGLAVAMPRVFYALARDGLMPRALGEVHPERRTPTAAIALNTAIMAVLAITGEFGPLAIAASLASMMVYVLGCIAAVVLRLKDVRHEAQIIEWKLMPVAAVVAVATNAAIILGARASELMGLAAATTLFALPALLRRRNLVTESV